MPNEHVADRKQQVAEQYERRRRENIERAQANQDELSRYAAAALAALLQNTGVNTGLFPSDDTIDATTRRAWHIAHAMMRSPARTQPAASN